MDRGLGLGLHDDPRLGLPVAQTELLARERAAGMEVHGQALAGVQQLDEKGRIGAEALDVPGAEPALGVGGDRVADERPVLQAAEAARVGAERRADRAEPLLGHVVRLELDAAQGGDPGAARVEMTEHVGGQDFGLHDGGTSPDPRTTSSVGTRMRRAGSSELPSRSNASSAARAPIR